MGAAVALETGCLCQGPGSAMSQLSDCGQAKLAEPPFSHQ